MNHASPSESSTAQTVLSEHYMVGSRPRSFLPHAQGGFSGARLWRGVASTGEFCLRRWPREHPTPERLGFIHGVLYHAQAGGFNRLALPVPNRRGESFSWHAGHLWELAPWLAGEAKSPEAVRPAEIRAALSALAEFHRAVESHGSTRLATESCPAVQQRMRAIERFDSWVENFRGGAMGVGADHAPIEASVKQILAAYMERRNHLRQQLQTAADYRPCLQPCLRDIWHEHVLFRDDAVSGIIDYGALSVDTIATDVARLLGSYARNQGSRWQVGLEGYEHVSSLSFEQRRLIGLLDMSGVLLGGMNWIDWLLVQGRAFADWAAVHARVKSLAERLAGMPLVVDDHWLVASG